MTAVADLDPGLDAAVEDAAAVTETLAAQSPADRAALLTAVADGLDAAADELVPLAGAESHLTAARLTGELARTTYQLRAFAGAVREGAVFEAVLARPDPDHPVAPAPDLRRVLRPIGPAAVFAASNFPFAFSVAGGDTASALAAGCPVVVKAHPGHPALSTRTGEVVQAALAGRGFPAAALAVVHGYETGPALLRDPRIAAGAFTGSVRGGRALFDIAAARPDPIPFHGELGSLNPVYVTPAAVAARGPAIVEGYVGSFTLGVGQFCTKPGLVFLPAGHGLAEPLAAAVRGVAAAEMLNPTLAQGYGSVRSELAAVPGVRTLVPGTLDGLDAAPTLLTLDADTLLARSDALLHECFGPTSVLVEYPDLGSLPELARLVPNGLTATVHAEESDVAALAPLVHTLARRAGRLIWNGWPTGVAVSPAMHHGGPYPASTSQHTSVGITAIRRFLVPVCYQSFPAELLPAALRDDNPLGIVRRTYEN